MGRTAAVRWTRDRLREAAVVGFVATAGIVPSCTSRNGIPDAAIAHGPGGVNPDGSWTLALTREVGLTGADGCASVELPGGRRLWLFADSIIGSTMNGRHGPGSVIVRNAIAVEENRVGDHERGTAPAEGSVSFWRGDPPAPGADLELEQPAFLQPTPGGAARWCWPAGGAALVRGGVGGESGQRLVMFYHDMARRSEKATDGIWDFRMVGTRLAVVDNPAADPGTWSVGQIELRQQSPPPARQLSWGNSVLVDGAELLIYGLDSTELRNKRAIIARVHADRVHAYSAWRFFAGDRNGTPSWSANDSDAVSVAEGVSDEFSVHRLERVPNTGRERWVMVHMEANLGRRVMLRVGAGAVGPWGESVAVYEAPEPASDRRIFVYGAKGHPGASREGELLVSYCVNSTDFWHMLSDVRIYRPRFLRLSTASLLNE
ncbi:MAG: DUF4185 domain-containing protein [Phycisphaerae bacterium]|nr:DUF4185 domain-containing protein [Phycisphaerae bacterium]